MRKRKQEKEVGRAGRKKGQPGQRAQPGQKPRGWNVVGLQGAQNRSWGAREVAGSGFKEKKHP